MEEDGKRIALIASKGTLDMAYAPLLLAVTGAGMNADVGIFFTLYGVDIVNKKKAGNLAVSPIANPAMPSPAPVPNSISILPGMTPIATVMMKKMLGKVNWPSVPELVTLYLDSGVRMIACTPTLEMTGVKKEDLFKGVEVAGAAEFLDFAMDSDISMFI